MALPAVKHATGRLVGPATVAASAALAVLTLVVLADVGLRTASTSGVLGTTELGQYLCMVGMVYLALPTGFLHDEHINAPLLVDTLGPRVRWEFALVRLVIVVGTLVAIGWYGLQEALRQMEFGEQGIVSGYPLWWMRFAIPVGALLSVLAVVAATLDRSGRAPAATDAPEHAGRDAKEQSRG